jgi:hypothetical protein
MPTSFGGPREDGISKSAGTRELETNRSGNAALKSCLVHVHSPCCPLQINSFTLKSCQTPCDFHRTKSLPPRRTFGFWTHTLLARAGSRALGAMSRISCISTNPHPHQLHKAKHRGSTDGTLQDLLGAVDFAPKSKKNAWQRAADRVIMGNRLLHTDFNKARRTGAIGIEDKPGVYRVAVSHAMGVKNLLLKKMIAVKSGTEFVISHSSMEQHTLEWMDPVVDPNGTELDPGLLNLYHYPQVSTGFAPPLELTGAMLDALEWLVMRVAEEPQRVFWRRDASGAQPILALSIANTPAALKLVNKLFAAWPRLLTQTHDRGPFTGESCLHVLAVNRREHELVDAIECAQKRLSEKPYKKLMDVRATGSFFRSYPMITYGQTVTSFAAACGLRRVVALIDMHDAKHGQKIKGVRSELARLTSKSDIFLQSGVAEGYLL